MSELSPTTKALFRAAREDGPGAAARSRILDRSCREGGRRVGARRRRNQGGRERGDREAVRDGRAPRQRGHRRHRGHDPSRGEAESPAGSHARLADRGSRSAERTASRSRRTRAGHGAGRAGRGHGTREALAHARAADRRDSLEREAELVAEARGAVVRGQPEAALSAIHAAQALPGHALEPEELSLEVRALRAMGELDAANAADAKLRARFPDHALAR